MTAKPAIQSFFDEATFTVTYLVSDLVTKRAASFPGACTATRVSRNASAGTDGICSTRSSDACPTSRENPGEWRA